MSGTVVLVEVWYETANLRLPTVGVGARAVIGVMIQALAIVTPIENGTGKRGVGCVGYFAMGAPASGVGVGSVSGRGG